MEIHFSSPVSLSLSLFLSVSLCLSLSHSVSLPLFSFADVPLTMSTLILLKWKDSKGHTFKFQLVYKVGSRWRDFGQRFGQEKNQLNSIKEECSKCERCWCKVMNWWLRAGGTAEYPATWRGLLTVLEDIECESVARELERVLSSVTPPPPPPPFFKPQV